jgi:hypothetical protein
VLQWNKRWNNCQHFCDVVVNRALLQPLVHVAAAASPDPHALLPVAHVAAAGTARPAVVSDEFCVPTRKLRARACAHKVTTCQTGRSRSTKLMRFRFGRHDDADVIDTPARVLARLGAAFGGPLYAHQPPLFPRDCTEAFRLSSQPASATITAHWAKSTCGASPVRRMVHSSTCTLWHGTVPFYPAPLSRQSLFPGPEPTDRTGPSNGYYWHSIAALRWPKGVISYR